MCGTNSCPRLSWAAYVGKELFVQVNNQAKFALLDPQLRESEPDHQAGPAARNFQVV